MRSIENRIEKLEEVTGSGKRKPTKLVMLPPDTREATDCRIAEAKAEADAEGVEIFIFEPVPAIDESINDFRQSNGLKAMDVEGWDEKAVS